MIVTEKKPFEQVIDSLKGFTKIFLVGCGECSTTCKTGGEPEVAQMKLELEKQGKTVFGACIPEAPCIASKVKTELAKNMKGIREAEAILVLSCGLGVQSVKENERTGLPVFPALDTLFAATLDAKGDLFEKCSMCAECVLGETSGICPVTLCSKGLLNGPCGGMNKGKCEVDAEKDCAWVLIYKEFEKRNKAGELKKIHLPHNYKKNLKPRKITLSA
ncbi:MAG: 5,10-methylenetetrahydrofolate reductase [Candidatus Omnitrophica bacterium]|nr:5,10-methylenetetrahydrofolate reductase [Candidatus Omnitrophota bacterium]